MSARSLRGDSSDDRTGSIPSGAASELRFSVSHSRSLALFAFARGCAVGVDVELGRRALDARRIAARAFGQEHSASLRGLPRDRQQREFLRLWTLHEARAKCSGGGMWTRATPHAGSATPHAGSATPHAGSATSSVGPARLGAASATPQGGSITPGAASGPERGPWLTELTLEVLGLTQSGQAPLAAALALADGPREIGVLDWNGTAG